MNARPQNEPKPVRLVFELARADNPRLYDELVRFPQGAKRVNRLRVLAYDGLLVQCVCRGGRSPSAGTHRRRGVNACGRDQRCLRAESVGVRCTCPSEERNRGTR